MYNLIAFDKEYYTWYKDNWIKTGGLLPYAEAGRILCVTKARINQMVKEGKLKRYRYSEKNRPFVSFIEIMNLAEKAIQEQNELVEDGKRLWKEVQKKGIFKPQSE